MDGHVKQQCMRSLFMSHTRHTNRVYWKSHPKHKTQHGTARYGSGMALAWRTTTTQTPPARSILNNNLFFFRVFCVWCSTLLNMPISVRRILTPDGRSNKLNASPSRKKEEKSTVTLWQRWNVRWLVDVIAAQWWRQPTLLPHARRHHMRCVCVVSTETHARASFTTRENNTTIYVYSKSFGQKFIVSNWVLDVCATWHTILIDHNHFRDTAWLTDWLSS